jgi:HD-like signal output (HDOD) protein
MEQSQSIERPRTVRNPGQQRMFGRWGKRRANNRPVEIGELQRLAPFAESSAAELHLAVAETRRIAADTGHLQDSSDETALNFLVSGSMRIDTLHKATIRLDATSDAARFPLPSLDTVAAIDVLETANMLRVPHSQIRKRTPTPPVAPQLTAAEAEALDDLVAHFDSAHYDLPNLPDLAMKIGAAIDDNNTSSEDIARLIQLDPVLSTRILSVVNSAAFGGISRVTSIPQATTRLGRRKVRSLVFSCLLKSIFKVQGPLLKRHMGTVWKRSSAIAALSYVLARETPGLDAEQALLAGLIHDIGSISVIGGISHFPRLADREEVFDHVMDTFSGPAGQRIVKHWRLESEFGEIVGQVDWHRIGSAIPEVADVVLIARLHEAIGSPRQNNLPFIDSIPAFNKLANGELTPQRSLAALARAEADVREMQALIGA